MYPNRYTECSKYNMFAYYLLDLNTVIKSFIILFNIMTTDRFCYHSTFCVGC